MAVTLTMYKYEVVDDETVKVPITSMFIPGEIVLSKDTEKHTIAANAGTSNVNEDYFKYDASDGTVHGVTSIVNYSKDKSYKDIYTFTINTVNLSNVTEMLYDYTKHHSEYYLSVTDGAVEIIDAKILSNSVSVDQIQIKILSMIAKIGNVVQSENVVKNYCGNFNIPDCIKFYIYGNYIVLDSTEIPLTSDVSNTERILVTADNAIEMYDYDDRYVIMRFNIDNRYQTVPINIGNVDVYIYTNLADTMTDITLQKLSMLTYKAAWITHPNIRSATTKTEIYSVIDGNETLQTSFIGSNGTFSVAPGFYRIYSKTQISPMGLEMSKYTELYATEDRMLLQFTTNTTIQPGEYIEMVVFDDLVIDVAGVGTFKTNVNEVNRITINKSGTFTASVFSKNLNQYVGSFTINVLDEKSKNEIIDIVFDETPTFGKRNILRLNIVDNYTGDITLAGDLNVLEQIDNSTYVVSFTKAGLCDVKIYYGTNLEMYRTIGVDFGAYNFGIRESTDGFYITAPCDMFVEMQNFVKFIPKNKTEYIEVYTTGMYELNLTLFIGEQEIRTKMYLKSSCNHAELLNISGRVINMLHPNASNISHINWYLNDSLYASMVNYINVPARYGNTVKVKLEYYVNGTKHEHERIIELKSTSELNTTFDVTCHTFSTDIVSSNPRITMKTTKSPTVEYLYFDKIVTFEFNNYHYIGDDTFVVNSLDDFTKSVT